MIEGLFQPMHLVVILAVALFFFGPKKLPDLGKGIAEGIRNFKSGLRNPNPSLHPGFNKIVALRKVVSLLLGKDWCWRRRSCQAEAIVM
jgi:TatA/E family protein of Tat protein translocase